MTAAVRADAPSGASAPARRGLDFTPDEFVRGLHEGRLHEATDRLIAFLDFLRQGASLAGGDEAAQRAAYGFWAEQAGRLLADPRLRLTSEQYRHLTAQHRELVNLWGCTSSGRSDAVIATIAGQIANRGLTPHDVARLLLATSLYATLDVGFGDLMAAVPELGWRAWAGALSTQTVLTAEAAEARRRLVALAPLVAEADVPFEDLSALAQIWYLCSYDDAEEKHVVKAHLNAAFRRSMAGIGIVDEPLPALRPVRERPVMLVPVEAFQSTHAMYRSFAPTVSLLRERFALVAVAPAGALDAASEALFERVIPIGRHAREFTAAVAAIRALAPDIVFYPSVGMATETIALANLRLAPVQAAMPGHPATTMSPSIDVMAVQEVYADAAPLFSETVVLFERGANQQARRPDAVPVPPALRQTIDGPVRVAVPSATFKLNAAFLDLCARIEAESARPVEYWFFPHLRGAALLHATRRLRDRFPGCRVFGQSDYNAYVARINECDLQLAPFPFGGTNSTMDALHQGLGCVTLEGAEVHARTDAALLRRAGLPEWLIAQDADAYVAAARRLIEDDAARLAIGRALAALDFDATFYDGAFTTQSRDLAELFRWLHAHHDAIRADGRRVWDRAARAAFGG